jgi:putative transposase
MTGIQALERKAPDQPMRPGKRERREFEYIRHGTQTLIASFDVATGQLAEASVGDSRTEADYLSHVQQLIASDPNAVKWHLVMDCLNTHQSESLVRLVALSRRARERTGSQGEIGHSHINANTSRIFA